MYNTKGEETANPNQEEGDTSKKRRRSYWCWFWGSVTKHKLYIRLLKAIMWIMAFFVYISIINTK
jgi:hypothetical protein